MNTRPESLSRDRSGTGPAAAFLGSPEHKGVSPPAPYLLLATHPLPAGSARGQPGKGRGGEVRARTSERPAEPQAGGEQDEAAGREPPHPATAAPHPALTPGGRRATCAGPAPPAALTCSLARGRRPQPARGLDQGGERALCNLQLLRLISARLQASLGSAALRLTVESNGAGARVPAPRQAQRTRSSWPPPCRTRSAME